ncbi:MAG: hypothetical protein NWS69_00610, partial [Pseudomonadales bacterium]|nr:hypothetical protein [Pseudomonadales bacterium]
MSISALGTNVAGGALPAAGAEPGAGLLFSGALAACRAVFAFVSVTLVSVTIVSAKIVSATLVSAMLVAAMFEPATLL